MNIVNMPYDNVKNKNMKDYNIIQSFIKHGQYSTNLAKYYKLKKEIETLKEKILAYGLPEKYL